MQVFTTHPGHWVSSADRVDDWRDMTRADATKVAEQLETAFKTGPEVAQTVLASLYADQLELHHVPALPSDGTVNGARMRAASGMEAAAIKNAIPDQYYDDVTVEVDGERVHIKVWIRGTLATGKAVRLVSDMFCTVRAGHIVAMEHVMDNDTMAAWAEVAIAGGLKIPEAFVNQVGHG